MPDSDTDTEAADDTTSGWFTFADRRSAAVFLSGLVAGLLLAVLASSAGVVQYGNVLTGDRISAGIAADDLQTYLDRNGGTLQELLRVPADVDTTFAVRDVQRSENGRWYRAAVAVTVASRNDSRTRTIPLYMTRDGRFLFFNPPVDLSQSLSGQVG